MVNNQNVANTKCKTTKWVQEDQCKGTPCFTFQAKLFTAAAGALEENHEWQFPLRSLIADIKTEEKNITFKFCAAEVAF